MSEPQPTVGQIWSARFADRRVRVTRVWEGGSVSLRTVEKIGPSWRAKRGGRASIARGNHFRAEFRFLETAP